MASGASMQAAGHSQHGPASAMQCMHTFDLITILFNMAWYLQLIALLCVIY